MLRSRTSTYLMNCPVNGAAANPIHREDHRRRRPHGKQFPRPRRIAGPPVAPAHPRGKALRQGARRRTHTATSVRRLPGVRPRLRRPRLPRPAPHRQGEPDPSEDRLGVRAPRPSAIPRSGAASSATPSTPSGKRGGERRGGPPTASRGCAPSCPTTGRNARRWPPSSVTSPPSMATTGSEDAAAARLVDWRRGERSCMMN